MRVIIKRMKRRTPKFFQKLRNTGLLLSAISTGIFAIPAGLPALVTSIAGYIAIAATVASAVSQTAVKFERR